MAGDFEFVVNSWRFGIDLAQLAHYSRVFFCREGEGPLFTLRVRVSIDELHIAHNECVLGIESRLCGPVSVRVLPLECDLLCALRSLDFFVVRPFCGMWSSLALILPHKPDTVFQGQLVQVDFCRLAFEHDTLWWACLRVFQHHCDRLLFIIDSYTLAVTEASANGRWLILIDLLKHDKLLSAWLHDLANFINIVCHTLNPEVDLGELEMNFNRFVDRAFAVRDEYTMTVRRIQRLDLAEGVRNRALNAFCYRLLKNLVSGFLAQDELTADA